MGGGAFKVKAMSRRFLSLLKKPLSWSEEASPPLQQHDEAQRECRGVAAAAANAHTHTRAPTHPVRHTSARGGRLLATSPMATLLRQTTSRTNKQAEEQTDGSESEQMLDDGLYIFITYTQR